MSVEGAVGYWCDAFTPDRLPLWEAMLAKQWFRSRSARERTTASWSRMGWWRGWTRLAW